MDVGPCTIRFSPGPLWDVQNYPLDDIDRIEVIRGPGGTLWGANAVNGVINIITKNSKDTQGGLVTAGAGSQEQGLRNAHVMGAKSARAAPIEFIRGPILMRKPPSMTAMRVLTHGIWVSQLGSDWGISFQRSDKMTVQEHDIYRGREAPLEIRLNPRDLHQSFRRQSLRPLVS